MKRTICILLTLVLTALLCACGGADTPAPTAAPTIEVIQTPSPEPETTDVPETPVPTEAGDWEESYLAFLEENYDIITALWPEGMSGVGFLDLDLDETPELVLFDFGASAALGATVFDITGGRVVCVSSTREEAAGAFGDAYFSHVSVCANFFEDFRAVKTGEGTAFYVISANGSAETAWQELIRFDCAEGVTVPVSLCARYTESDPYTGEVTAETYEAGGEPSDGAEYEAAFSEYAGGEDSGYEAEGVSLWDGDYDTDCAGLLAMAEAAAEKYVPVTGDYFG